MDNYQILIERARNLHGEICPGVVLGTKMSMAAMKELGMDPTKHNKDLIVYVEIDRCITDAIQAITGCTLGQRNLKYRDYGKFIATFVDMATGRAIRVSARDDKLDSCPGFWTWLENTIEQNENNTSDQEKKDIEAAVEKLSKMSEKELLKIEEVKIEVPENDIPGFPQYITICSICGEHVIDQKEFVIGGEIICESCASKL